MLAPERGAACRVRRAAARGTWCVTGWARAAGRGLETADCFGGPLYGEGETDGLPDEAVLASLGCGNPLAVAELREGERVLDLGSGGGIDVLLSARRVGPSGFAYGVDMTDDMLALARQNAAKAGAANVEFRQGPDRGAAAARRVGGRGDLQLRDQPVHRQARRAGRDVPGAGPRRPDRHLRRGGRGSPDRRRTGRRPGSYVGCIAGALSRAEYLDGLAAAGFTDASVTFTPEAAPGMHAAIIRAVKPAAGER